MRYAEKFFRGLTQVLALSVAAGSLSQSQRAEHYSGLVADPELTSFVDEWRMQTRDQGMVVFDFDGVLFNDSVRYEIDSSRNNGWATQSLQMIRPVKGSLEWLASYFFSLVSAQDEKHCFDTDRGMFAAEPETSGIEFLNEASLCYESRAMRDANSAMVRRARLVAEMQVDVIRLWLGHFFQYVPVHEVVLPKIAYQFASLCPEGGARCFLVSESAPWFMAESFRALAESDFNLVAFSEMAVPCLSHEFDFERCHLVGNQVWIHDSRFTAVYDRRPMNFSRDAVIASNTKWQAVKNCRGGAFYQEILNSSVLIFARGDESDVVEAALEAHSQSRGVIINNQNQAQRLAERYPFRVLGVSAASVMSLETVVLPHDQSAPRAHDICDPFHQSGAGVKDFVFLIVGAAGLATASLCYVLICVKRSSHEQTGAQGARGDSVTRLLLADRSRGSSHLSLGSNQS